MDPFTLLALATAAGFVFNKAASNRREERREFTFGKELIANHTPRNASEFDLTSIEVLPEYRLIRSLVEQRWPLTFVTGGAGTGKSTLVRWILQEFAGATLLGAPTGTAAVNIGGKTLHSLCQLPPGWITQKDIQAAPKRQEILEANLLIIDEISMVTANLLDGVSAFFRLNRGVDKPFGGLPVIMVGDLFQLPPVIGSTLRQQYQRVYSSPKFYNARCLQKSTYYAVELNKTYRQSEQHFVDILSRLREGVNTERYLACLNSGCTITEEPPQGAIWLSPRRAEVEFRNQTAMRSLPGPERAYHGELRGRFSRDRLPSPAVLYLKRGAQVAFTRNDPSGRWISGSIGKVQRLLDERIFVEMEQTETIVDVGRITWKEYQYGWNKEKGVIDRQPVGSYRQFPLVPGWAMTIHASQGKTLERVHLDLGAGSFETGQTYVGLSRCRSLAGLSMARPLSPRDLLVDQEAKQFYDQLREVIARLPPERMAKHLREGTTGIH
jgi:ATP-dependent exoDNAse (exonuclease V) alpha subunit